MSRRVIIVVEGDTEEEFVRSSIAPHFLNLGIFDVRGIKIRTSSRQKGGIGSYLKFRNNVEQLINQEKDTVVSSLLDYFRLPSSFPKYVEAAAFSNSSEKVSFLEEAMAEDIGNPRFIPYIQLHEFEALLFTDLRGFEYCGFSHVQLKQITSIISNHKNPEDINNDPETAPSKRLLKIFPGYSKVLHGNIIVQVNGFPLLLKSCPRFNYWIQKLIEKAKDVSF